MASGKMFTGVGCILDAAHKSKDGVLHGHTWEIEAWWLWDGTGACERQAQLNNLVAAHDHGLLQPEIAWAEQMAEHVGEMLGCESVEIRRDGRRLFARWEK